MTRGDFLRLVADATLAAMAMPAFALAGEESRAPADVSSLARAVSALLDATPHNRLPGSDTRIYGAPLFGVSIAQDPLYQKMKKAVGPRHYMPVDLLPGAKTVISWFLPYSEAVSQANYGPEDSPALWILAHKKGAEAAELVRRFVSKSISSVGARVFVPFHDSRYRTKTLISNWSERHVAFISGLGTFGLHKNIITEKGTSGRLDSVITDREFTPTKREYAGIYDRCINCHACVRRCPAGAIKETGKDIRVCARRVLAMKALPDGGACGKCLTQVSCENCIPARLGI